MTRFLLVVVAVAALSGCGGTGGEGNAPSAPATSAEAETAVTLTIENFKFSPNPLKVTVGQKITVVNEDSAGHTATASDGSFDTKDLSRGETYTFTAEESGTFDYICDIHQYMTGQITVS